MGRLVFSNGSGCLQAVRDALAVIGVTTASVTTRGVCRLLPCLDAAGAAPSNRSMVVPAVGDNGRGGEIGNGAGGTCRGNGIARLMTALRAL
eukprot:6192705-Pleurochrysis_carterae.AAC.3